MGCTEAELQVVFTKAVVEFNKAAEIPQPPNQQKEMEENFRPFLHPNAIVFSAKDHQGHSPRASALAFLEKEITDHPIFEVRTQTRTINGNLATIHGDATWFDDDNRANGTPPDKLKYIFKFICDGNTWFFLSLAAVQV